jgi:hypothetical protein
MNLGFGLQALGFGYGTAQSPEPKVQSLLSSSVPYVFPAPFAAFA